MNLNNRKYIILFFILFIGILYFFGLIQMQLIDVSWKLRAQEISEKRKVIVPARGIIFDRNKNKIVSNITYYNLMFVEKNIVDFDTSSFAKLVNMSVEDVKNRFLEIKKKQGTYYNKNTKKRTSNYLKSRAYPFLREITASEMAAIAPYLNQFKGFYKESTSMRLYPYNNAANILGYIAEVSPQNIKNDPFYKPGYNVGKTGIERYYEKELRGEKGVRYSIKSAQNNAVEPYENGAFDTLATQGAEISLGLDIKLQQYSEKLMQNKKGCVVAIEPSSGEILTLVSSPTFNPNLLVGKKNISKNYPALVKNKNKPLFPRPLAAEYPPGSIFKLVQSLIGLQEKVVTPNSSFPCTKSMVGCHNHPKAKSIAEAIKYSCNPYYYYLMRKVIHQKENKNLFRDAAIGLEKWVKYMHRFNLGRKIDTDIPGLRSGLIPDVNFYNKWYGKNKWKFSTIRSIAIGQGEVKLTPIQMANIAAIIANRGWYYTPHFIKKIENKKIDEKYTTKNQTGINKEHFEPIISGMHKVIYEAGGTARLARIKNISICGKTGTVQNPHGKDHSVFIAFAPKDNPKIAVAVFVENAGFGGTWAAPIASLVIEKYIKGKIENTKKETRVLEANLLINTKNEK